MAGHLNMHFAGERRDVGTERVGDRDRVLNRGSGRRIRIARQRDQDVFERHGTHFQASN